MKKAFIIPFILMLCLCGCGKQDKDSLNIAVMIDYSNQYPGYAEGVERAIKDIGEEYSDSFLDIKCEFYSFDGSYAEGAALADSIASDESIDAVIADSDMQINKTAAHIFDKAEKLFIVPYFLYDSVFSDNSYSMTFSMCRTASETGGLLRAAASKTTARRWAVCAADGDFEREEMNGFLSGSEKDGIKVVDCVDISETLEDFDGVYRRWELLGVDGVVMFPTDEEGFEVLKKIRSKSSSMVCMGDSAFDDSELTDSDEDMKRVMTGFIMADEFSLSASGEEEDARINEMAEEYEASTGFELDTWYIQGYNAVRMVADTAADCGSGDPKLIAEQLHKDGYSGLVQYLVFDEKGSCISQNEIYNMFDETGYPQEMTLSR